MGSQRTRHNRATNTLLSGEADSLLSKNLVTRSCSPLSALLSSLDDFCSGPNPHPSLYSKPCNDPESLQWPPLKGQLHRLFLLIWDNLLASPSTPDVLSKCPLPTPQSFLPEISILLSTGFSSHFVLRNANAPGSPGISAASLRVQPRGPASSSSRSLCSTKMQEVEVCAPWSRPQCLVTKPSSARASLWECGQVS